MVTQSIKQANLRPRWQSTSRLLLAFVVFSGTCLLGLLGWLHSGVIQEPPATVFAATRLEIQQKDILTLDENTEWLLRTGTASAQSPLTQQLAIAGWTYVDQMGAGWFYKKQGEQLIVSCRLYSPRYQICQSSVPLVEENSNE